MTSLIDTVEQVVSPTSTTSPMINIHSACTSSCSFDCTAERETTCYEDACSEHSCGDHHHEETREHAPATNMPLVVGPALVSPTAVANGCKSCYTRPPHLRAKCCGPGKAKLFKKKSKVLGAVLAESGILSDLLEKEKQEKDSLSNTGSYIHLTQFTSVVGEENNCTKEVLTTTSHKEHVDETLIEQANHSSLPPLVDVSTHQEAIEKPSRMRSFLSGLLQRKQKVMVTLGFSGDSSTTSMETTSDSSLTTTEN
ncbi:hypothetical protein NAEGRDRAFT_80040 [Naegleria gruberi]|uniref:Uncharacterized protein n=1 Tax=Naegleria gruberi TaxID=5762 RepID=D2VI23_NAEGR|nr:uncharacterized protein NAEGRDRAFT_80040 [Naegleria gruberi]EFC43441.1 hypothetical protein NAEGRDRAFT_80040 [Naegleria gruberi]|eukprot:XP_002676185.1 hypothetical protein NAEGRDRAFT_80040 [Naegleria gruberi strain NEG-M]